MATEDQYKEEINTLNKRILFKPRKTFPKHTSNSLACPCSVCEVQKKIKVDPVDPNKAKEDFANYEGQDFSFISLLQELGKAANEHPIKINIPETVVFQNSRPAFIITQKPDRTIKMITSGSRLKLNEIRKTIPTAVRLRKKEVKSQNKVEVMGKEVALVKFMHRDFDNERENMDTWTQDGALRVLQEFEFLELFAERPGSQIWKKISYIQGVVKSKMGLNGSFFLTYYSHNMHDYAAVSEIQKAGIMDDDKYEMSLMEDPQKYSEFICKKIVYMLAIYSQIEILRFRPEFIKDENGKIWFFSANKIAIRQINHLQPEVFFKKVNIRSVESKETLNEEIKGNGMDFKEPHQLRMKKEMVQFYDKLKSSTGIRELLQEKMKDQRSDAAFKQLRPFSPYTFTEISNPSFRQKLRNTERVLRVTGSLRSINQKSQEGLSKLSLSERKTERSVTRSNSRLNENLKKWITPLKRSSVYIMPCKEL